MFRSLLSSRFKPHRYCPGRIGNWSGHLPFGADLIDALKPSLVVELGTHYGESYFGFCQAIQAQGLSCQAYAVDSWVGDSQTGWYGPEVFQEVSAYNAKHYQSFSTLLRTSFDEAIQCFSDGTIDLLHLDGCHTYEAIQHDFCAWLPKVRAGGVILLHDIAVRKEGFGTWRFWEEVSPNYPSFAFHHGCGLGVILKEDVTAIHIPFLAEIFAGTVDPQGIRDYYAMCAERLQYAHQAAGEHASSCQVFSPDTTGYSEERSSAHPLSVGTEATVEFSLPSPTGRLRLDPCDCPCVIEISDIVVERPSSGAILWRLDPARFHEVQSAGTSIRIPHESRLILCSYGDDPQLYLPSLESLNPDEPVGVRCRLRIDRDWAAMERLWRQVEAGLDQARRDAAAHGRRVEELEADVREHLTDKEQRLNEYERELAAVKQERLELERHLAESEQSLDEYERELAAVNKKAEELQLTLTNADAQLQAMRGHLAEKERELTSVTQALAASQGTARSHSEDAAALRGSLSWKVTAPLRAIGSMVLGPKSVGGK